MKRQPRLLALLVLLAIALPALPYGATTPEQRRAYLEKLNQILPAVPSFNMWLQRTGELPPDFDALPKINGLPDPLQFLDGHRVQKAADWKARRAVLFALEQKYDLGYVLSPQFNRDATPSDVRLAVEQAKKVYGLYNAAGNIMLDEPWDYNRLPLGTQERVIQWMAEKME